MNISLETYIDIDNAHNYFMCIDKELLDTVITDIKSKESNCLSRKLFKRYY